jgi:hypothetical protein
MQCISVDCCMYLYVSVRIDIVIRNLGVEDHLLRPMKANLGVIFVI